MADQESSEKIELVILNIPFSSKSYMHTSEVGTPWDQVKTFTSQGF